MIILYHCIVQLPKTLAGSISAAVKTKSSIKLDSTCNVIQEVKGLLLDSKINIVNFL